MKSILLFISLFIGTIASATVYYISPTGNDVSGTGTAGNPWKTLYKATSSVNTSGDVIYVNPGTYTETQQSVLAAGVSIEGAGNTSVIKSTLSATFQEIISVRSNTQGSFGNQSISYIKMDGSNLTTSWGICIAARSNVSIHHCEFFDFRETAVNFSGIVAAMDTAAPAIYATGNSFHDNIVYNCSSNTVLYNAKYGKGCLQFGGQKGFECYNNDIQQPKRTSPVNDDIGWPIKMANQGHIKGCKIYNNILKRAPIAATNGANQNWNFSFEMWNIEGGMEFYNNTCQGEVDIANCSKGFTQDGYTFGMKFYNNTVSLPALSNLLAIGIRLEVNESDIEISNNTFSNLTSAISISPYDYDNNGHGIDIHRINIHHNLFYNMGKIGGGNNVITMDNISVNAQCYFDDFYFDNNTLIAAPGTSAPFFGIEVPAYYGGNTKNIYVRNNHFGGFNQYPVLIGNGNNVTNLFIQNNNFYNNGVGNSVFIYSGGIPALYSNSGNTVVTPNFNALFQPNAGSPLIDAGVSTGMVFNGTAPDIGYFETGVFVPNIPPTANAGADQTIALPTNSVALTGSGTDSDGSIVAYQWNKISGPAGTITNAASAATNVTGLVLGTYLFELTVTDNAGSTGKDTMQVTVLPDPNIPPTADAGPDQSITLPTNSVTITGSGTDPDGNITAYQWTKVGGPAAGAITNPASASTTVTGLTIAGTYTFELRVTDNNNAVGRDSMQVVVNPNPVNLAPTANAGPDQSITLPTSSITFSGSGTDPDGNIIAYLWTKIAGPAAGSIANSGNPSSTVTGLAQGVYQFELRVTDNNGDFGRDTMQVTVNPAPPNILPVANAGADQTITLPTNSVTLSGSGTDPDGNITAYQWTKISGPAVGSITNPTSATTTVTGLSIAGIYRFVLRVTDNSGGLGRDTMQVTVNPAPNVAPSANAGADKFITLPVNSTTLNGSGTDPDGNIASYQWTKITGPANATITSALAGSTTVTGLTAGIYSFELKVTDNSGATGSDTVQVTVNIPPVANAGTDISITIPVNSISLTGAGTDSDGSVVSYNWSRISGPAAGTITNAASAATSVTGLIAGIYKYELRVTDNHGGTGRDTVQVIVFAPNIPPVANAGLPVSLTLPTNVVTLSGSGTDVDGFITGYLWTKISGPANATITSALAGSTSVTGLVAGVYVFELRVTDNNGATGRATVQVTVNPENIPPTANAGADQSIILPANRVTLSGRGTDVDGTVVAYRWKQIAGPADKLISPNTAITVLDNMIEGNYKFELTVTDDKGAVGKDTVGVAVLPMAIATQPNTIKIYPNPITDFTTLEINKDNSNQKLMITITDLNGRVVYQKQVAPWGVVTKETLDFSKFSKGAYLVTVAFNGNEKITVKAIKQ